MSNIHRLDLPDAEFAAAFEPDPAPSASLPSSGGHRGSFTRLVSCHVSNFGRLHNQDFDFEAGLNVIDAANGVGKTTLANFVRAMFYGFDANALEADSDNLRERYRPWQGGTYGGSLIYVGEGGTYRIERTFGTSSADDFLAVYDCASKTGSEPLREFSGDLGFHVFGMDADTFERSTYVARLSGPHTRPTQAMLEKISGGSIRHDSTPSPAALDQVAARHAELCQRSKHYSDEMRSIEALFPDGKPNNIAADELDDAIVRYADAFTLDTEESEELLAVKDFVARSSARFADKLPSASEIKSYSDLQAQLMATRAQIKACGLDEQDAERLKQLRGIFGQSAPKPEELDQCQENISKLDQLEGTLQAALPDPADIQRVQILGTYFTTGVPDDDEIQRCRAHLAGAATMRSLDSAQLAAPEEPRKSGAAAIVLALLGICLIAAGLVTAVVMVLFTIGVCICIAGGTLLIIALFLALISRSSKSKKANEGLSENEQKAQGLEEEARAFTSKYAKDVPPDIAVETIDRLKKEYLLISERVQKAQAEAQEIQAQIEPVRKEIDELLGRWNTEDAQVDEGTDPTSLDSQSALARLRSMLSTYTLLQQKESLTLTELKAKTVYATQLQLRLTKFLEQYYTDVNDENSSALMANLAGTVSAYAQALDMLHNAQASEESRDRLQQEALENLQAVCRRYGWNIEEVGPDFVDRLYAAAARYPVLVAKTDAVRAQLRELVASYGPPPYGIPTPQGTKTVEDNFSSYIDHFTGIASSGVAVDENAGAVIHRQGRTHEIAELSQGYSDVIAFCMRMALGDALFAGTTPFVILDDPFVNLDDRHLPEALAFVRELAENRQIIYLTCHSSRTM